MVSIKESPLAFYFHDVPDLDSDLMEMNFLDMGDATKVWKEFFNGTAKGLYDLPNDSWIVKVHWVEIGIWIDSYNGKEEAGMVPDAILNATGWSQNENLFLVQDCRNIVSLTFDNFSKHWEEFLAAFDDGPLLMPRKKGQGAVCRFVPMGGILMAVF